MRPGVGPAAWLCRPAGGGPAPTLRAGDSRCRNTRLSGPGPLRNTVFSILKQVQPRTPSTPPWPQQVRGARPGRAEGAATAPPAPRRGRDVDPGEGRTRAGRATRAPGGKCRVNFLPWGRGMPEPGWKLIAKPRPARLGRRFRAVLASVRPVRCCFIVHSLPAASCACKLACCCCAQTAAARDFGSSRRFARPAAGGCGQGWRGCVKPRSRAARHARCRMDWRSTVS